MSSQDTFFNVFLPVFTTKLAALGYAVRNDEDVKHLLKIAGQLKAVGAKSSLDLRSDLYKSASEAMAGKLQEQVVEMKKEALDASTLAAIAGAGALGGNLTSPQYDDRGFLEKSVRGAATGLGTAAGAGLGQAAGGALADIISKKVTGSSDDSSRKLIEAIAAALGGAAGYGLTSYKG